MEYLLDKSGDSTWEDGDVFEQTFGIYVKDYHLQSPATKGTIEAEHSYAVSQLSHPLSSYQFNLLTNAIDVVMKDGNRNMISNPPSNDSVAIVPPLKQRKNGQLTPSDPLSPSVLSNENKSNKKRLHKKGRNSNHVKAQLVKHLTAKQAIVQSHVKNAVRQCIDEKPYVCPAPHCGLRFSQSDDLKSHIETSRNHSTYSCPHCSYSATEKCDFDTHMETHAGTPERPYACSLCDSTFAKGYVLNNHIKNVHNRVRPHTCDTCGRKFFNSSGLEQHIRSHTGECPFKCNECGKSYRSGTALKRHILVHKGIKAHKCETCGKSFTQKPTLQAHIRIHTGVKPFQCEICKRIFTQLSSRNSHLKSCLKRKKDKDDCENNA